MEIPSVRLLINCYEQQPEFEYRSVIGIDDFAFKKRHTYETIIVDEKSHRPIAILDGRDGKSLRQWLKDNKKIRTITRDRANAYAKVIAEELPDIMQVADRFHLHQNLLEAIKKTLNREVPVTIAIPHENEAVSTGLREEIMDDSKKTMFDVGNFDFFITNVINSFFRYKNLVRKVVAAVK